MARGKPLYCPHCGKSYLHVLYIRDKIEPTGKSWPRGRAKQYYKRIGIWCSICNYNKLDAEMDKEMDKKRKQLRDWYPRLAAKVRPAKS